MTKKKKEEEKLDPTEILKATLDLCRKKFGDIIITGNVTRSIPVIKSILPLDIITGLGGIPRGRITEIFGPESSGKTTLALQIIANAQKEGGLAAFIDAEHALEDPYATSLGVDISKLVRVQPESAEQGLDVLENLLRSRAISVIAVDSVSALVPQKELEGEAGCQTIGLQARLMSQELRKIVSLAYHSNTAVIFLNQIRALINTFGHGPKTTTSGGNALKFYSALRLHLQPFQKIPGPNKETLGYDTLVTTKKNKLSTPLRQAHIFMLYGKGFDPYLNLLEEAKLRGIIQKEGNSLIYKEEKLGTRKSEVIARLRDPETCKEITDAILSTVSQLSGETQEITENEGKESEETGEQDSAE